MTRATTTSSGRACASPLGVGAAGEECALARAAGRGLARTPCPPGPGGRPTAPSPARRRSGFRSRPATFQGPSWGRSPTDPADLADRAEPSFPGEPSAGELGRLRRPSWARATPGVRPTNCRGGAATNAASAQPQMVDPDGAQSARAALRTVRRRNGAAPPEPSRAPGAASGQRPKRRVTRRDPLVGPPKAGSPSLRRGCLSPALLDGRRGWGGPAPGRATSAPPSQRRRSGPARRRARAASGQRAKRRVTGRDPLVRPPKGGSPSLRRGCLSPALLDGRRVWGGPGAGSRYHCAVAGATAVRPFFWRGFLCQPIGGSVRRRLWGGPGPGRATNAPPSQRRRSGPAWRRARGGVAQAVLRCARRGPGEGRIAVGKPGCPGSPPAEPYVRFSRIRLSGRWFYLIEDGQQEPWPNTGCLTIVPGAPHAWLTTRPSDAPRQPLS